MDNIKKILKKDVTMWVGLVIVLLAVAGFNYYFSAKKYALYNKETEIEEQIEKDADRVLKENPDFVIYFDSNYIKYLKENKVADKIEVKDFEINKGYTEARYSLVNNYDFDIVIYPDIYRFENYSEMKLYDFNKSYMIIPKGESREMKAIITHTISASVNKEDFEAFRVVHKNDKEKTPIGYIRIRK